MYNNLVLVLNCGSSSLKFAIIDGVKGKKYLSGIAECLYLPEASIKWKIEENNEKKIHLPPGSEHSFSLNFIVNNIIPQKLIIDNKILAIGHRIVHGGKYFSKSVIINSQVLNSIKKSIPFAPLHNPSHLIGINEIFKQFPKLINKNVAVFDTAFHQTIPKEAYLYAIPYNLYKKYGIRRYGAHGISHYFVVRETSKILNKSMDKINLITCHLGNGGSVSAVKNGKCIDTSMGLTPLEGLVMGTRSGDIDPAIIFYLNEHLGFSIQQINELLTKKSGLLGISGVSSDCRYIEKNYFSESHARLAMDIYCHRLSKYIAAYSSLIGSNLDALVFTGGIGENSILVRKLTLQKLSILGFKINNEYNLYTRFGKTGIITDKKSRFLSIVIPTNEELIIAQDTIKLTSSSGVL